MVAVGERPAPETPDFASMTTSPSDARARERGEREQRGGRVAARVGDEVGVRQPRARELGEPVDGRAEQLGRPVGAVPVLVDAAVGEAEVGREVDHPQAAPAQLGHHGAAAPCG